MRRGRTLVLVATLAGCSSEMVERPPPPPVNWGSLQARSSTDAGSRSLTDKERAAAVAYVAALGSQDFAPLGPLLHEQAHFAFAGKGDAHGRDRVVKAHEALFGPFGQRKFTLSRIWLTDSAQALEWTMSAVHANEWRGVKATEKSVSTKGVTLLWTNDDG
ncbi:MAG TPA: nuclear transport factor 2 family protein, partial [Chloroflexota bacterium]|nr:nuclear transport factor 2 family protein [Chloroflexota bacterium]